MKFLKRFMIRNQLNKFMLLDEECFKINSKINKWDIWPIIRYNLSEIILSENNIAAVNNKNYLFKQNRGISFLLKKCSSLFLSILSFRYFFKQSDILVINDQSTILPNSDVNISETFLTYCIRKSLLPNKSLCIIDIKSSIKIPYVNSINISELLSLLKFFYIKIFYTRKLKNLLNVIFKKVKNYYGIEINWASKIITQNIVHQILLAKFISLFIFLKNPKIIIYSDDGRMRCVNKIANKHNIKTIHYQHGLLSSETINHRYAQKDPFVEYRSDYFFAWGDYRMQLYNDFYKCIDVGNPYFNFMFNRFKDDLKNKSSITIISDGNLTLNKLSELALALADHFSDKIINYKLRYEEYDKWINIYPLEFSRVSNINVIDTNDVPLYQYFNESDYVIGTSSTALVEAIGFAQVIVYKIGFYFEIEDYIYDNIVLSSKNIKEIINKIENNSLSVSSIKLNNIFKTNSQKNINDTIDKILSGEKIT